MHELTNAMRSAERVITRPSASPQWRGLVRNRLVSLRGAYIGYLARSMGGVTAAVDHSPWLDARLQMLRREQARVADELDRLIDNCGRDGETETLRRDVAALLNRLDRSRHREVDLLYQSVDMDLGGEQ